MKRTLDNGIRSISDWMGIVPRKCDICERPVKSFIDGATKMGPWAIMCIACHSTKGIGLGLGKGQKYLSLK